MTTVSRKARRRSYLLPFVLGTLMLASGIESYQQSRYLLTHGQNAVGKVVSIDKIRAKNGGRPVIQFNIHDGRLAQKVFDDPLGGTYKIGEQVSILYDPRQPLQAKINSSYGLYAHLIGITLMCAVCWGIALWMLMRRRLKSNAPLSKRQASV